MKTHAIFAAALVASLAVSSAQQGTSTETPPNWLLHAAPLSPEETASKPPAAEPAPAPAATPEAQPAAAPASPEPAAATAPSAPGAENENSVPGVDEPLPLIPESLQTTENPPEPPLSDASAEAPVKKPDSLEKGTAAQLRQAIRIRELKTIALEDSAIQAQRAQAEAAKTYEGRRTALRNYYALINAKIIKLDPSVREAINEETRSKLLSLEQRRVRPSVLIEPIKALPGSHSSDYPASNHPSDKATPSHGSSALHLR